MELRNSLYNRGEWIEENGTWRVNITLHSSHIIFQSHFPGEPVMPGVCILQIAKELLEDYWNCQLKLIRIKNVKFLSVITPEKHSHISFVLEREDRESEQEVRKGEDAEINVRMHVESGDTIFSKISMTVQQCKH